MLPLKDKLMNVLSLLPCHLGQLWFARIVFRKPHAKICDEVPRFRHIKDLFYVGGIQN